jgi:hypothetical protein
MLSRIYNHKHRLQIVCLLCVEIMNMLYTAIPWSSSSNEQKTLSTPSMPISRIRTIEDISTQNNEHDDNDNTLSVRYNNVDYCDDDNDVITGDDDVDTLRRREEHSSLDEQSDAYAKYEENSMDVNEVLQRTQQSMNVFQHVQNQRNVCVFVLFYIFILFFLQEYNQRRINVNNFDARRSTSSDCGYRQHYNNDNSNNNYQRYSSSSSSSYNNHYNNHKTYNHNRSHHWQRGGGGARRWQRGGGGGNQRRW